jgi:glyoxalase family protein
MVSIQKMRQAMNTQLHTKGIHHITAVASSTAENLDFYRNVLGLRLVKKTVNFDDPHTYHFYYGDYSGTPGTILIPLITEAIPE